MTNQQTLSVGIPAYNESANIKKLVEKILAQKQDSFKLEKIIVISDGSQDDTVSQVNTINNDKIYLVNHLERKGKAVRFQELLELSQSDILVQFDADTIPEDEYVLERLAVSIGSGADLALAALIPLAPNTYVEKIALFGVGAWENVLSQMKKEETLLHRCMGRCRAFSRGFYKSFILPVDADSVEDIFSYCFAVTNGFSIQFVDRAVVRYRLPSQMKDFLKQSRRFVKGSDSLAKFYDSSLIDRYKPTTKVKLKALIKKMFSSPPHISIGYVLSQLYVHKTATMESQKPMYEYVGSTKKL